MVIPRHTEYVRFARKLAIADGPAYNRLVAANTFPIRDKARIDAMSRRNLAILFMLPVCLAVVSASLVTAQQDSRSADSGSSGAKNPYNSPQDIKEGGITLRTYCSTCHGVDRTGGRGPDLTRVRFRHGSSDQALMKNIQDRIPGTAMAEFNLPDSMILQVVAFIRSKRGNQKPLVLKGDANRREKLFAKNKCPACHWTGREGGRRGSDLSTSRSTLDYERTKITDPNADLDPEYQLLVIIENDGRQLQGVRLNENSCYVQLIDELENLRTVAKSEIDELHRSKQLLMPSYTKELTEPELDDLVAYLFSLRKRDAR